MFEISGTTEHQYLSKSIQFQHVLLYAPYVRYLGQNTSAASIQYRVACNHFNRKELRKTVSPAK